ncbi:uncharacterized protein LOC126906724 isoform X3 [Daktulosphaira vitifoliae]|uniref:uncharacterized protein LOC126906724 isoform X3 n=1 Tax=Daktulosphaira vitifoliae TaxID=58002 RepID=UPI0021A9949E|nr:uncharacterized protein LOC126906724 isoform X3 [Daktulosphaira vitifoliae]
MAVSRECQIYEQVHRHLMLQLCDSISEIEEIEEQSSYVDNIKNPNYSSISEIEEIEEQSSYVDNIKNPNYSSISEIEEIEEHSSYVDNIKYPNYSVFFTF